MTLQTPVVANDRTYSVPKTETFSDADMEHLTALLAKIETAAKG